MSERSGLELLQLPVRATVRVHVGPEELPATRAVIEHATGHPGHDAQLEVRLTAAGQLVTWHCRCGAGVAASDLPETVIS